MYFWVIIIYQIYFILVNNSNKAIVESSKKLKLRVIELSSNLKSDDNIGMEEQNLAFGIMVIGTCIISQPMYLVPASIIGYVISYLFTNNFCLKFGSIGTVLSLIFIILGSLMSNVEISMLFIVVISTLLPLSMGSLARAFFDIS